MKRFSELTKNKQCLYRYRTYNLKALEDSLKSILYFSKPEKFNDPYDNLIFANTSEIVSEIIGNILNGMDGYLKSRKDMGLPAIDIMEKLWSSKPAREKMLAERKELIFSAIDAVRINIRRNSRIICFSENNNSMLMWSHYADYHRGYLIVYDKGEVENAKRYNYEGQEIRERTKLLPVRYVNQQTDMTEAVINYIRYNMFENMGDVEQIDATLPSHIIRTVITEKSKEWEYEKEWRLIPNNPKIEVASELAYIKCRPLAIIVGSKCQDEDRESLVDTCKKLGVPVYGIFLSETNAGFKLVINDEGNLEIASSKYEFIYRQQ